MFARYAKMLSLEQRSIGSFRLNKQTKSPRNRTIMILSGQCLTESKSKSKCCHSLGISTFCSNRLSNNKDPRVNSLGQRKNLPFLFQQYTFPVSSVPKSQRLYLFATHYNWKRLFSSSNKNGMNRNGKSGIQIILQYLLLFPIAYASLLAGASITHNILKPDLTIPNLEEEEEGEETGKEGGKTAEGIKNNE